MNFVFDSLINIVVQQDDENTIKNYLRSFKLTISNINRTLLKTNYMY